LPDESTACLPYLRRQVQLVRPKVILALGATAAESLLGVRKSLGALRGAVHSYGGVPLVVTYHPAALLRNPNWKKPTWDDVRIARQLLDR
jgi:DNA polymerase